MDDVTYRENNAKDGGATLFLDRLPPEVRNRVYRTLLASSCATLQWNSVDRLFKGRVSRAVRQTCWQIRNETRFLVLQFNSLRLGVAFARIGWDMDRLSS